MLGEHGPGAWGVGNPCGTLWRMAYRTRLVSLNAQEMADYRLFAHFVRVASQHFGVRTPQVRVTHRDNAWSNGIIIAVDPAFLDEVLTYACPDGWCDRSATAGVAIHEMTHHIFRDASRSDRGPRARYEELRCDFAAGWLCSRLRLDPRAYIKLLRALGGHCTSSSHPAWRDRQEAAAVGASWSALPLDFALSCHDQLLVSLARRRVCYA